MPTGSYDSSLVSRFILLATQPLSLSNNNVTEIQLSYQPLNLVVNTPFIYVPPVIPRGSIIVRSGQGKAITVDASKKNPKTGIIGYR